MRVQKVKDKKRKQVSRSHYAVKTELAKLIELVNMLPPEQMLQHLEPFYVAELERRVAEGEDKEIASIFAMDVALGACLENLPEDFRAYVNSLAAQFDESDRIGRINFGVSWYTGFRAALLTLRSLASLNKLAPKGSSRAASYIQLSATASTLFVDKQKRIRVRKSTFAEAVEGVEYNRIRECEICRRIFWANREDKLCCSKEHGHVLRSRRARANWEKSGELYLRARREKKAKTKKGR